MAGRGTFTPFQLPASWDGRDVEWRAWEPLPEAFICPPRPPGPCERCQSTKTPLINQGIVHPHSTPGVVNLRPSLLTLTALRCPNCSLDTVWDRSTDEWWVLDAADYGSAGSADPRLPSEPTTVLSCRDLWDRDGGWSRTLLRGSLRPEGRTVVTDRTIAIYTAELEGCTDMPAPPVMTRPEILTIAFMLVNPWLDEAPTRLFNRRYLDVLEFAGYVIRPIGARTTRRTWVGYRHAHAIVDPAGRTAGVLMPGSFDGAPSTDLREVAA